MLILNNYIDFNVIFLYEGAVASILKSIVLYLCRLFQNLLLNQLI